MNPSGGLPAFSRASFNSATTSAHTGVDALVPSERKNVPLILVT